jgi:predicted Zn-dependent protease
LAHEIGHLKYRHALRHILQDSATGLLIVFVTGDVSSILGAIPTGLLLTKYSRDFEREADDFALQYLDRRGIDGKAFSDILLRMEKERPGTSDIPSFLSTHPSTEERARRSQQKP